jgi:hypothetical protein
MTDTPNPHVKTHTGRCHCGAVHFVADVDATQGTSCNCTICRRINQVSGVTKPGGVRVTKGQEHLTRYPNPIGARYFCKVCGIHLYGEGDVPEMGGAFMSVSLNTLDDVDTGAIAVAHWDGRHDNWQAGLRPTPWPVFPAG